MARAHSFRKFLGNILGTPARSQRKRRRPKPFHEPQIERLEDRLAPAGDLLITGTGANSPVFQEYTSTGTLVRTVSIPPVPNDVYTGAASIAQDSAGNVYVYDGDTTYALAIYNPQSGNWNELTYQGQWSHDLVAGYEGLALEGQQYAYVNNQLNTSGPGSGGVIRFDLSTGVGTDFNPMGSDTISLTMGLDGNLYALGNDTVFELNPNTMALENTILLPNDDYRGIAADAAGDVYTIDLAGVTTCFNSSGTSIRSIQQAIAPISIAIAPDGTLAEGEYYSGVVLQMTNTFANPTTFYFPDGAPYLTYAQTAPPGPASPAQSIVSCSATTLQSGTMTAEVTLTAKDANGLRVNNGGLAVQFGLSGTAAAVFTAVTDNGDGTYTAYFTATSPGTATITATMGGQPVTSTLPSLTINPSPTAGNILVTLQPSSGPNVFEVLTQAGAVTQTVAIPSALGGAGGVAGDYQGDIYVSHGTISVPDVAVYTAAAGTWSALTASGFGGYDGDVALDGNYLYTACGGGGGIGIIRFDLTTGIGADFTSINLGLTNVTLGLDGNLYAFCSSNVFEFNPITMNLINTIDLPYTNYYGLAVNASGDIYATEYNLNIDEFNPAGVMINQAQAPADVGILDGLANGPDGSLLLRGNSGHVVRMTGALTVISDFTLSGTVSAAFQPLPIGPPAQDVFTAEPPANVSAGTPFGAIVAVQDANNNTVQSYNGPVTISLASSANGGSIGGTLTVNAVNGVATFNNLIRTVSGTCTLLATAGAFSTTSSSINVAPGAVSLSQSTLSVASATDLSGVQDTVTFTAKDAYGNPENSGGLSVAFGQSGGTSTGTIGAITDHNNGTYTAAFTGVVAGTAITITATVGGSSLPSTLPTVTVVPGAVSLAQSIVTPAQPTVQSGSTDTVTLTAKDAAGNQETGGGLNVIFGLGVGTSTGSFGAVIDHNNGTYTATFTGIVAGNATPLTATIGGNAVTSTASTITVTPDPVSASQSFVSIAPSSIQSGSTATVTLTAKDAAGNVEITGGQTVVFGLGSGTSTGSFSAVTDHNNGTYTATFTGILAGSARTITATIGGVPITSAAPTVTVTPGAASLTQSTVSVVPSSIQSGSTAIVTLTARDAAGNQESSGGLTVAFGLGAGIASGTFGSVSDNGNGTYSAIFTGVGAGSPRTITATIGGSAVASALPTIVVTPGPVSLTQSLLLVTNTTPQAGSTTTVTMFAKDAAGNQETTGGLTVAFGLTGTLNGSFSPVVDNSNGTYTSTFTVGTVTGVGTVTASIGGSAIASAPTVTIIPAAVSLANSTISITPATIATGSATSVTLTTRDIYGNLETTGGPAVTFALGTGSATGTYSAVTDHGNGTYTATFTGVLAGTNTITATIGGGAVTSSAPAVTVTPGPVSLSHSIITIVPGSIQSGATAAVALIARDAAGNQESGGGLSIAFGLGTGSSTGTFSGITDDGNGIYTATFTGILAGTSRTITASIGGLAVTSAPPTITVVPGPLSLAQSIVTIVPSTVVSGSAATVTLTAKDAAGNQETTGGQTVVFHVLSGSSTGSFSGVTDHANGTYTATFTGILAGTAATIGATIGGSPVTSTSPTVTVIPGPVSLAQSSVVVVPASIQSGSSANVTLTARDAAGNQEGGGGLSVAFGLALGTSTGSFSAVTDHGNGAYTATFTGVLAGAATPVTATIGGSSVSSALPTVTVTPGPVSLTQSTISVGTATVMAGNVDPITLTARDAAGNQELGGGLGIAFNLTGGTSTGTLSGVIDHGNGTYTANFTALHAGTSLDVTATIGGNLVTSTSPTVTVTLGPPSLAQSTVSIAPNSIQSGSTAVVTLTTRDAGGNQETYGGAAVSFSVGAGTATGSFTGLTDHGDGTYSATFTGILAGTSTILAFINGQALTSAAPTVTVTPGPLTLANSTVVVSPASIQAGSTATVTLTTRDAAGNRVANSGAAVSFSLGAGGATGTFSAVRLQAHTQMPKRIEI